MEKIDRLTRVNVLLQRELGNLFEKYLMLPAGMLVSVVEIRTSVDLRNATVFVSIFGGGAQGKRIALDQLHDRRGDFQRAIARSLGFKHTPVLLFKADDRIERGDRVFEILDQKESSPAENK